MFILRFSNNLLRLESAGDKVFFFHLQSEKKVLCSDFLAKICFSKKEGFFYDLRHLAKSVFFHPLWEEA
jgi:hypothetical protein